MGEFANKMELELANKSELEARIEELEARLAEAHRKAGSDERELLAKCEENRTRMNLLHEKAAVRRSRAEMKSSRSEVQLLENVNVRRDNRRKGHDLRDFFMFAQTICK